MWSCRPEVIGPVTRGCGALGIGRRRHGSFNEQKRVAGLLALPFLNSSEVFETLDLFN